MSTVPLSPAATGLEANPSRPGPELARAFPAAPSRWSSVALVLVVAGWGLRLAQYISNRSFFLDEAALTVPIRERGWLDLFTRPLEADQTAPPGFLLLQKAVLTFVGGSEHELRLFPLLAALVSVPLFVLLARRFFRGGALVVPVAVFALSVPLIYYSADAKPYSYDLLASVVLLGLAARVANEAATAHDGLRLGGAAAFIALFSQPALLVTGALGFGLLVWGLGRRGIKWFRVVAIAGITSLVGVVPAIVFALRSLTHSGREYMQMYWASGFLPLYPRNIEEWLWLPRAVLRLGRDPLGSAMPITLALLIVAGFIVTARRDRLLFVLAGGPLVAALLASALRQYPFGAEHPNLPEGRVLIYLVPSLLLLIGSSLVPVFGWVRRPTIRAVLVLVLVGPVLLRAVVQVPVEREELRPILEYVREHRRPGEALYVYYGARHAFSYYAPRLVLEAQPLHLGTCARTHPERYLSDVTSLARHASAWVVLAHPMALEDSLILSLLDRRGARRDSVSAPGARAVFYDLRSTPRSTGPIPADLAPRLRAPWKEIACGGLYADMVRYPPARG